MKNSTRGLVAGGLGVALLAGGATFALWSDSERVDGGTITAGNLELWSVGSEWEDISSDRDDAPHVIDLSTFLIVPGDTVQGTYSLGGALAGENMVATLSVASAVSDNGRDLLADEHGVTVTYDVVVDGETVHSGVDIDAGSELAFFAAKDNGNPDGAIVLEDGQFDLEVVITAAFDGETPSRVRTNASAALAKLTVDLEQARAGADVDDVDAPGYTNG